MESPRFHQLPPEADMTDVHALLIAAFAYMEGRIDPPSSLTRMTPASFSEAAMAGELWVAGTPPVACMVLTPQTDTLYLGKMAIAPSHRGSGLARRMIAHATERAKALGLPSVTLQTRIELVENQKAFTALGFTETGRTAHAGYPSPTSITYCREV